MNAARISMSGTDGLYAAGIPGSDFEKQAIANTPLVRAGQPDDVALPAVFLGFRRRQVHHGRDSICHGRKWNLKF